MYIMCLDRVYPPNSLISNFSHPAPPHSLSKFSYFFFQPIECTWCCQYAHRHRASLCVSNPLRPYLQKELTLPSLVDQLPLVPQPGVGLHGPLPVLCARALHSQRSLYYFTYKLDVSILKPHLLLPSFKLIMYFVNTETLFSTIVC